jgi:hypothetical protein
VTFGYESCKSHASTANPSRPPPSSYLVHDDVEFHRAANSRIVLADDTLAYGCLCFYELDWYVCSWSYPSNFIYCFNSNMISFILDSYCFCHRLRGNCACSLSSGNVEVHNNIVWAKGSTEESYATHLLPTGYQMQQNLADTWCTITV